MSESYSLPTEPEGVVVSLLERFNSRGRVHRERTACVDTRRPTESRAEYHEPCGCSRRNHEKPWRGWQSV
jgi:hypothetical protein